MYFWFGYDCQHLLFSTINVSSVTGIIVACICTVGLVFVFEFSKLGLTYSKFYSATLRPNDKPECLTDDMLLIENQIPSKTTRYAWFIIEVGFYIIELIIGYLMMLLVMTYNAYLLLSVLLASGFGYFLLGHTLMLLQIKTSKLNLQCQKCNIPPIHDVGEPSSLTSSTEAISDGNNEQERCCVSESTKINVAETKN